MASKARTILGVALLALFPAAAALAQGANFSRYVAVGDSLTAGFQSGGLAVSGQTASYPKLLHLQATGSDAFEQPRVSDPGIPAQLFLQSLAPLRVVPKSTTYGNPLNLTLPRPYDNLGVPGADVHDLLTTVTDGGGMHDLILRGLGTQVQQALSLQPTFLTVWIGNNDALAAATSGLVIEGVTLTPLASFEADYRAALGALAGSGAKLAIGNIPRVTAIPFVTTLPPVVLNPETSEPVLINGQPVPLIGPDGPLAANDFVLLPASAEMALGRGIPVSLGGSGEPLSDSAVLSAAEAATIQSRVDGYNAVIRSVAQQYGAALVDAAAIFDQVVNEGVSMGGVEITADYLTGGLFSYDGVHPTDFGYAFMANAFILAINEQYDAGIPQLDLYPYLFGGAVASGLDVTPAAAQTALFTPRADRALRWALGIPSKMALEEIKRNLANADPADPGAGEEAPEGPQGPQIPASDPEFPGLPERPFEGPDGPIN